MKKAVASIVSVIGLCAALVTPARGDDLALMSGKWSVKKTNDDGQRYTQHIEIKKDKFTFKVVSDDGETRLFAEGDLKLDKAGPFKTVAFTNIKAGGSESDTSPIDDTFNSIYKFGDDDTLLVVMNFDKERDEPQKPRLDAYRKVKSEQK